MAVKVLVVDDSSFFRRRLSEILEQDISISVIDTASNGREAVDKVKQLKPDVVTMDIEMPVMDGITAVRQIMASRPTPVLMFSSLTHEGARATLDALDAGAIDFLPKKFEDIARDKDEAVKLLQSSVKTIARHKVKRVTATPSLGSTLKSRASQVKPMPVTSSNRTFGSSKSTAVPRGAINRKPVSHSSSCTRPLVPTIKDSLSKESPVKTSSIGISTRRGSSLKESPFINKESSESHNDKLVVNHFQSSGKSYQVLAIGTSTGGPVALQAVLSKLPANFPYPIMLIQHMPSSFTSAFATRLNHLCQISVKEAASGDALRPGWAYLAPGGKQMVVEGQYNNARIKIVDSNDPKVNYKPSVDICFASLARIFKNKVLAVVLTGMGADGRDGAKMLKMQGSTIWAQDEDSSVVYGMPQAVMSSGLATQQFSLDDMADNIITELK